MDEVDGSGVDDDAEQSVLRLARRRRRGRRAGLALVPAVLLVWFVVSGWDDGPPDPLSILLLVLLGGGVTAGWWWLERSAGQSAAELPRRRGGPGLAGRFTDEELADARAEVALRTCSPPPPGGRIRVEGLVDRWSRDARLGLWMAPCFVALALAMALAGPARGYPVVLPIMWAGLAVVQLVRSLRWRRVCRRWLAAHGTPSGVAGHP